MTEEKYIPLGDIYTEEEQAAIGLDLSEELARRRHDDYEAVVNGYEFTQEHQERIFNGESDPAETAYAIAKEGSTISMEDILDNNVDFPEPDSESVEGIFGS